ncbi:MAG TPA: alginate lyase family protein [Pyrinomonadaceae bacterium]|nr:alginate lyase family protein [Chloracidobacterium sp.]MBP9935621.1 alginate lyase family protein [Pyrinomonadaceae bacterium]MBK9437153.1 alginate lyase family protein [Chloracidobacterium sp.]MBL0239825.1 alginate lyase family protein [Chloracidobacterium sp.]HQY66491.1 alginate lyase family protein [Pyrinomonadaceae bacterium]
MAEPLQQLKKIRGRSWDELRTRSSQVFSAYGEKLGFGEHLPDDDDFAKLIDPNLSGSEWTADALWQQFFQNSDATFFPAFKDQFRSAETFVTTFGESARINFIKTADRILEGKIDLLGFKDLNVGVEIDWHFEPISGKQSPIKHWKEFDELDSTETGDKKVLWELNRHQHFFTLGVAFWLTKDERYAVAFADQLDSWMDQNPPGQGVNWASSLEVAYRAMSWLWAFQLFRHAEAFSIEIFAKALKYLYLHGRHIERYLSKYYSPNTHLTGEALGLYYLGTQMPFLTRAEHWRKVGEDILMEEVTRQIYDDGVYFEQSTWYQRYTVDIYLHFVVLRAAFNNEPSGAPTTELEQRLEAALEFMMFVTRPDGTTPIIGDDDGGRLLPLTGAAPDDHRGTLAAGAALFGRGDIKAIAGSASQEVFWLCGPNGLLSYSTLIVDEPQQTSKAFRTGGYYAMRDGWLNSDNYLLIDCGEVGAMSGGHGHADALAIDMALQGKTLLVDSGTYTYHESKEMRDYFRSTKAHNTLTVDDRSSSEPGSYFSWKSKADASANEWLSNDRFDFFEGEHDGYRRLEKPTDHSRSVLFLKQDYFLIRDFVKTTGVHEHSLNFHLDNAERPVLDTEGDFAAGDNWRIFAFGDGGRWQQDEGSISNIYGKKTVAPFLRFVAKGSGSQEFFSFILPGDFAVKPEVTELEIEGGRAFAIFYRGYTDLIVYADNAGKMVRTELFDTNFRFTWARVGPGESVPQEYVLVGGNRFEIDGFEVIGNSPSINSASIRRFGNDLYVRGEKDAFRISLPHTNPTNL